MSHNGKNLYELKEAKTALLLSHPFFASLLMDMMKIVVVTKEDNYVFHTAEGSVPIPTMATDGRHVIINEDFFVNNLTIDNRVAGIAHEVGHAMFMHLSRGKQYQDLGFDGKEFIPMLYNVAGDYVINDMLNDAKVGVLGKGWLHDTSIATHKDNVDDVYRKLYDKLPPDEQGGGESGEGESGDGDGEGESGDGEGQSQGSGNASGSGSGKPDTSGIPQNQDTHIYAPAKAEVSETQWKRAMVSAMNNAKAVGRMPSSISEMVEQFMEPVVTWQKHLRMSVERKANKEATTTKRINRRRYIQTGLVWPARTGHGAGHIVVALDTSGSVSNRELQQFFGELASILDDCKPEKLTYIETDAVVQRTEEVENPTDLMSIAMEGVRGRGGTCFIPTFEWVAENIQGKPDMLIYFTDMGTCDRPDNPGYPVIWASTVDGYSDMFDYGKFVYVQIREKD